jgi:apolipoprotein N-acyltransferase
MKGHYIIYSVERFLWAGSSALLLCLAALYPELRFLLLIALIPFLWDCIVSDGRGALILGVTLALCYTWVTCFTDLWYTPGVFLTRLLLLAAIFSLYGLAVNRLARYVGFNAVFIALLWLPLEYTLEHLTGFQSISSVLVDRSALILRIGSLFGLLTVSFVIVLINALILICFKRVVETLRCKAACASKILKKDYPPFEEILLERFRYFFSDIRSPPSYSVVWFIPFFDVFIVSE